jgi:type IV pilus assembly protein PilW
MKNSHRGFSLIELMVALAIGLFIISVFGYLYLGSKQTYRSQDGVARIQENARFAFSYLAREVRQSGLVSCYSINSVTPKNLVSNAPTITFNAANATTGFNNGGGWTAPAGFTRVAGTDVLRIQRVAPESVLVKATMASASANVVLESNALNFATNETLVIADCSAVNVFRAEVTTNAGNTELIHDATKNSDNRFLVLGNIAYAYPRHAMVARLEQIDYFVGTTATNTVPTLYAWSNNLQDATVSTPQAVLGDIDDFQLRFGLWDPAIASNRCTPLSYVNPASTLAYENTVAVRVSMRFRSPEQNVSVGTAASGRIRQTLEQVISLRNRNGCQT